MLKAADYEAARVRMEQFNGFSVDNVWIARGVVDRLPGSYRDGLTVYVPKGASKETIEAALSAAVAFDL